MLSLKDMNRRGTVARAFANRVLVGFGGGTRLHGY